MRSPILRALFALLILSSTVAAQELGSIRGTVRTTGGQPVARAKVTLVETNAVTFTRSAGRFAFEGLPAGRYHVLIESDRASSVVAETTLQAGAAAELDVVIDIAVHREEIVVSASPEARALSEVYQPVSVLTEDDILLRARPSLGETLSEEPGVSSTWFGPGSSRPVIRGIGGDRIRILEEGVGVGDASNVSPDHAVAVDPLTAERIEIIRGPATLLYGSNAVGGVVNVIDERVPSSLPVEALTGSLNLGFGSVADEALGSVALRGSQGQLAWQLGYLRREAGDYRLPERHDDDDHDDDHDEDPKRLENSSLDTSNLTAGASWIFGRGYVGLAVSNFRTNYGIPGHGPDDDHDEEEDEDEHEVRVDMEQRRYDLKGQLDLDGFFRNVRVRIGRSDYEHFELEDDDVETTFLNDSWEARVEASHRQVGRLSGAFGAQISRRDFRAFGEEAFVPPSKTDTEALFVFEELDHGPWLFQGGLRWEQQGIRVAAGDLPNRSFNGVSASVGTVWRREGMPFDVAASIARAVRLPTAEELYSDGPHAATRAFEIGDPFLDEEVSLGFDLSFRRSIGHLHGEINLFHTRFDGYIFLRPTGTEEDHLPVFVHTQGDATFRGFEVDAHYDLWHSERHHVEVRFGGDYVEAELRDGTNLPRISPARVFSGLAYEGRNLSGGIEVRHVFRQSSTAPFEEPTDSYTMLGANASYRFLLGETAHYVLLRGRNLTDEFARSHVSPLKDLAPLPGRDFSLAYRVIF
jgi:iron complex outermembrane recepter protein